jgi:hypothetical protein
MFAIHKATRVTSRRYPAAVTFGRPNTSRWAVGAVTNGTVPEWMTECWKHRVEGEARLRLTRNLRDIGRAK